MQTEKQITLAEFMKLLKGGKYMKAKEYFIEKYKDDYEVQVIGRGGIRDYFDRAPIAKDLKKQGFTVMPKNNRRDYMQVIGVRCLHCKGMGLRYTEDMAGTVGCECNTPVKL